MAGERTNGRPPARAPRPPTAGNEHAPLPHEDAAQGHTGLDATLARIAALHEDLARMHDQQAGIHQNLAVAYRDLAEYLPDGLAAVADPSLYASVSPPPEPRPAFLTQGEVAELLQCDARTVRRLELEGEIPSPIGSGRLKRWRARDFERLVEGDER